jgi:hypothetical protein
MFLGPCDDQLTRTDGDCCSSNLPSHQVSFNVSNEGITRTMYGPSQLFVIYYICNFVFYPKMCSPGFFLGRVQLHRLWETVKFWFFYQGIDAKDLEM